MRRGLTLAAAIASAVFGLAPSAGRADSTEWSRIAQVDLTGPFHTRTPWRFVALQSGMRTKDVYGDLAPGEIQLCLAKAEQGPCAAPLEAMPTSPPDLWPAHVVKTARIVRPRGEAKAPLLLIQTASLAGVDGGYLVFTQLLAYRRDEDRFVQAYGHVTGHNNNQEVRYIESGPLKGDVISAEPMSKAPFGYWITVDRLTPAYAYRPVLRYPSATRYNDGNSLAVIDAEMPNIERRLGFWRPGSPLPLPAKACPKPQLIHTELWCADPPSPRP
jgi:hypothetical protein